MHLKDLLGSFARVGYCIPVPVFYLVLFLSSATWHSLPIKHYNGLINQSINQSYNFYSGIHCRLWVLWSVNTLILLIFTRFSNSIWHERNNETYKSYRSENRGPIWPGFWRLSNSQSVTLLHGLEARGLMYCGGNQLLYLGAGVSRFGSLPASY